MTSPTSRMTLLTSRMTSLTSPLRGLVTGAQVPTGEPPKIWPGTMAPMLPSTVAAFGSAVLPRDRRVRAGHVGVHRPYSIFGVGLLSTISKTAGTRTSTGVGLASRSGAMLKVHCFDAPTADSARSC